MKQAITLCGVVITVLLITPSQSYKILSKEFEEHSTTLDYIRTVNKTIDDALNGKLSLKCSTCEVLVEAVQLLVRTNASEDEIVYVITQGCIILGIEDKRVCSYIIEEFREEFITVAARLLLHPAWLCYAAVGPECGEPVDIFPFWNVTIPPNKPKSKDPVKPPEDYPKLKIVQLSDVHIDLAYKPGSKTDCGEPLCCRDGTGDAPNNTAGFWGSTSGQCDIPLYTYKNALQFIAEEIKPDIIFWTGDIPAHDVWNQTRDDQIHHVAIANDILHDYFPYTHVYPSLGNHESSPVDCFPPPGLTSDQLSNAWLNTYLQSAWSKWLPPESLDTVGYAGYYSVQHNKDLRIISLNTQYCDQLNFWLYLNNTDPGGMLQWLVEELSWAEAYNIKVIILGHIPSGASDCFKAFSWNYYKIVDRFENIIVGQYVGHTHKDEIRMFFSEDDGHPTGFQFIAPSLTTYSYMRPSFRVYTIDGSYDNSSYHVLDHMTYLFDLERANQKNETVWEVEYTATKAYNMSWITPKEMYKLYHRLNTDRGLFNSTYQRFYEHSRSGFTCDDDCYRNLMCQFITGRSHDPNICKDVPLHQLIAFELEHKLC